MGAERYRHMRGSGSTITDHVVWCRSERRTVLTGAGAERVQERLLAHAADRQCLVTARDVRSDPLPLVVECPPTRAPPQRANQCTG